MTADAKRLVRLLGDAGYPTATVTPDVNRKGNDVTLAWAVTLGPRMRVGPIFVRGNFVTRPRTILQQIRLGTGDYLRTTPVERSQRDIGFLQLFNNATPISFPGKDDRPLNGSADQSVPMLVNVEERYEQYQVLHFGAGASTDQKPPDSSFPFGVYLRGGYDDRNLAGRGWTLTSQLTYGTAILRANVGFLDRRFLGTLFRFDASFTYLKQETVRLGDIHSGGGSIGFSREMYPGVDAGLHYNLRNTTHTEPLLREAGPNETTQNVTLGTTVGSLSANVEWLRMDNRLLPTRGFRIDAIAELALPALSHAAAAVPLRHRRRHLPQGGRPLAVGDPARQAHLPAARLPLRPGLPLRRRGAPPQGRALLRRRRHHHPRLSARSRPRRGRAVPPRPQPAGRVRPLRRRVPPARRQPAHPAEHRPAVPHLPPWYGSVFMDNGVVADSFSGLGLSQFRHGVGVSPLLIRLPIGDVSLAWGWPLDPGPGDTRIGVLHVNVGLMF